MAQPDATVMTPAEWELMRIVWTMGEVGSSEVIALIQQKRDWSASTIKTLLSRLVKKSMLTTQRVDRRFTYQAVVPESTAMQESARALFAHLCGMKKGGVLLDLIQETPLARSDIEALQAALAQKLPDAPATIACDCLPNHAHC
ncbi:CopY/TcrY family copper transport repressor [Lacticaseibacillus daqingensis]|uniref:CopY/TcrY family copper transport repressor n=1 Tax=Lacticaseibacillus daqingensis TaxID=2486014 RepID=UPI000F78B99C|nr:CopY/TcrY family copper transport repressor [Lacticaseibacillus daqingensis]